MRMLEQVRHRVERAAWASASSFRDGELSLDREEVGEVLAASWPVTSARVHIVSPGSPVRINRVLDVLAPCKKIEGDGETFPGVAGAGGTCGDGVSVALEGLAVVATGTFPRRGGGFDQMDCLIDMVGPGADYSLFSDTINVVVEYDLDQQADLERLERAVRESNVRLARWLAGLAAQAPRMLVEEIGNPPFGPATGRVGELSPARIAYVWQPMASTCPIHDTLLLGRSIAECEPQWLSAGALADGALVNANFFFGGSRIPTYMHQRNPIVELLDKADGRSALVGVLVGPRRISLAEKRLAARDLVDRAVASGVDGIITHPAAGGNSQLDGLYLVQEAAQRGISSAMVVEEMGGPDGTDPCLLEHIPEADLLVSIGNRDEALRLTRPEMVLGDEQLLSGGRAIDLELTTLDLLCGSMTHVGSSRLMCVAA